MLRYKLLATALMKYFLWGSLCAATLQAASKRRRGEHGRLQHQSTGYLRTRGQEALYETSVACAFNIDLSLLHLKTASETQSTKRQETSECVKLVLVSFNTHALSAFNSFVILH